MEIKNLLNNNSNNGSMRTSFISNKRKREEFENANQRVSDSSINMVESNSQSKNQKDKKMLPWDDCIIGDVINNGANGVVFEGTYNGIDLVFKTNMYHDEDSINSLKEEIKKCQFISNNIFNEKNIIKYYGYTQSNDGKIYLIFDVCTSTLDGKFQKLEKYQQNIITGIEKLYTNSNNDQYNYLSKRQKTIIMNHYKEILGYCIDACTGMEDLHDEGVCHYDLHCGNILIKNGQAVIIDFGNSLIMNHKLNNFNGPKLQKRKLEDIDDFKHNVLKPVFFNCHLLKTQFRKDIFQLFDQDFDSFSDLKNYLINIYKKYF